MLVFNTISSLDSNIDLSCVDTFMQNGMNLGMEIDLGSTVPPCIDLFFTMSIIIIKIKKTLNDKKSTYKK